MSDDDQTTRAVVTKNGPITIKGAVSLEDQDGNVWTGMAEGKPVALCRCGNSASKPFCDGTHSKTDFASDPNPTDDPYPWA